MDPNFAPQSTIPTPTKRIHPALNFLFMFILIYFFLISIKLMGGSFKLMKGTTTGFLNNTTENPFVALFIGILVTSIVQSSSVTTSVVVTMVASGSLALRNAIPIIMGANIGTTVTCALVAIMQSGRKQEFKKAFAAATVHDFFNLTAVIIFLPLEIIFNLLEHSAILLTNLLDKTQNVPIAIDEVSKIGDSTVVAQKVTKTPGILDYLVKPPVKAIQKLFVNDPKHPETWAIVVLIIISLIAIFAILWLLMKVMRSTVMTKAEKLFDKIICRHSTIAIASGAIITALVQSSSVTTSLLVPMAAAGIITIEQVFPMTLGANIGTTVTALLAAMAVGGAGITIAFVHLLFNLFGTILIYYSPLRKIPLKSAKSLAELAAKNKVYALLFVAGVFFILPLLIWQITNLF